MHNAFLRSKGTNNRDRSRPDSRNSQLRIDLQKHLADRQSPRPDLGTRSIPPSIVVPSTRHPSRVSRKQHRFVLVNPRPLAMVRHTSGIGLSATCGGPGTELANQNRTVHCERGTWHILRTVSMVGSHSDAGECGKSLQRLWIQRCQDRL